MISAYLIPVLAAVLGIVMLAITEKIFIILIIALGAFLIISGSTALFQLSKLTDDKVYRINLFFRCGVSILLGVLCIILSVNGTVEKAVNVMLIILGVYAAIAAISEIVTVLKLKELGLPVKGNITEIAGTVIAAVALFLLASPVGPNIVRFCGIAVIIAAIILAIAAWRNSSAEKVEVEVIEDADSDNE